MVAAGEVGPWVNLLGGCLLCWGSSYWLAVTRPLLCLGGFLFFFGGSFLLLAKDFVVFFAIKLGFFSAHVNFANDRLELLLVDTSVEPSVNIGVLVAEGINHNVFVEHDHVASNRNVSKGNSLTYKECFGHKVVVEQLHGTFDSFFCLVACIIVELIHAQGWVDPSACCWLQNTVSKDIQLRTWVMFSPPFRVSFERWNAMALVSFKLTLASLYAGTFPIGNLAKNSSDFSVTPAQNLP